MQLIPSTAVRSWSIVAQIRSPASIATACPHCNSQVVFSISSWREDPVRKAGAGTGECPSCALPTHFWAMRNKLRPADSVDNPAAIYMYPAVASYFQVTELPAQVPDALKRSFFSTIDAFNARNFVATAVCGRRTLEGIFTYLLPEGERKQNLARLIDSVTSKVDLASPLRKLSHAIRSGGNLGAHFDTEREPTEQMARQIVELVDYLISYLYVLPEQIETLEASLEKESQ